MNLPESLRIAINNCINKNNKDIKNLSQLISKKYRANTGENLNLLSNTNHLRHIL